jgi:hypothetical protein
MNANAGRGNLIAAWRQAGSQNRIYEAGVGVKQKINELRFGRQARLVAGGNVRVLKFSWLTI